MTAPAPPTHGLSMPCPAVVTGATEEVVTGAEDETAADVVEGGDVVAGADVVLTTDEVTVDKLLEDEDDNDEVVDGVDDDEDLDEAEDEDVVDAETDTGFAAAQEQTASAADWTPRPVTAPQPAMTQSNAALIIAED